MGRPRKRRAIAASSPQRSGVTPNTSLPLIDFDFSDLGVDGILQPGDWAAMNDVAFPSDPFTAGWPSVFDDPSTLQWDAQSQSAVPQIASNTASSLLSPFSFDSSHPPPSPPQPPILEPPCTCLPTLCHTLSSLQSLNPIFPLALSTLRSATSTVRLMLYCQTCSPSPPPNPLPPTTLPNTMLLAALIPYITTRYSQLLAAINTAAASCATKTLRVGEIGNPLLDTQHTGDARCPAAVEVELSAEEWRAMMRGVVRKDLVGADGKGGLVELVGLIGERQRLWHERAVENGCGWGGLKAKVPPEGEKPMCLRVVEMTRCAVEMVGAQ
ncbi:hypothetical protein MMC13_007304 [Lambiella insularis]|nr:hypothetical protein [Lambiella insularis]